MLRIRQAMIAEELGEGREEVLTVGFETLLGGFGAFVGGLGLFGGGRLLVDQKSDEGIFRLAGILALLLRGFRAVGFHEHVRVVSVVVSVVAGFRSRCYRVLKKKGNFRK